MKGFPFVFLLPGFLLLAIFSQGWAQNPSTFSIAPPTFQALPEYQQVFVLGSDSNLWLEDAPFGNVPPQRTPVDGNVQTFQALDTQNVYVLGRDGKLWLEQAPFGKIPPRRMQVDANVHAFQASDPQTVLVLGDDGNLWLEQRVGPLWFVPPPRQQIDANVSAFELLDTQDILVLGNDGKLWLVQPPFGNLPPSHRTQIDANVAMFQESTKSTSIFVLGRDRNLWLEQPPFGSVPPRRQQIDANVKSFQALTLLNWVWVLGTDGNLWLEEGPFGKIPPARQQFDSNVVALQSMDIQNVVAEKGDGSLWLDHASPGQVPPKRVQIDGNVALNSEAVWSAGSKPFDLIWATNGKQALVDGSGVDRNGLPLNPRWFAQMTSAGYYRPNFQTACFRPANSSPGGLPGLPPGSLGSAPGIFPVDAISDCTSQPVTTDMFTPTGPISGIGSIGGLCQGLLDGHLNWFPVTYTGTLYWDDWSAAGLSNLDLQDDDYNLSLVHSDYSGLTSTDIGAENLAPSPALLLEFNSDETTGHFGSSFWTTLRDQAQGLCVLDNCVGQVNPSTTINGNPAIVTGLLGLDGVHAGYTELHPVYSMAIHLLPDSPPLANPNGGYDIIQHWAFFIRNYGDEGNCSQKEHYWDSASKDSSGRSIYYIQLPWPTPASGAAAPIGASVSVEANSKVWLWQSGDSWSVQTDPGYWTYLEFDLTKSDQPGGVGQGADGEVYLRYTLGHVPANPVVAPQAQVRPARAAGRKATRHEEIDWAEIQRQVTDPVARQRLRRALAKPKPTATASKSIPQTVGPKVAIYNPAKTAHSTGNLTLDRAVVDPAKEQRVAEIKAALAAQTSTQPRRLKRQR